MLTVDGTQFSQLLLTHIADQAELKIHSLLAIFAKYAANMRLGKMLADGTRLSAFCSSLNFSPGLTEVD